MVEGSSGGNDTGIIVCTQVKKRALKYSVTLKVEDHTDVTLQYNSSYDRHSF